MKQGPLAFYPYSFRNYFNKFIEYSSNRIFKSDLGSEVLDGCFTSEKKLIPIFYKPGDILISRQDNIHGDFPAQVPFERSSLVLNIFDS